MKKAGAFVNSFLLISLIISSCSGGNSGNETDKKLIDSLSKQLNIMTASDQRLAGNKKLVSDFYQELFGDKNVDAIDRYIDDNYIQHNPSLPDGKQALKSGATIWFKGAPKEKIDIQHLNAEGDLVYIHTRSVRGTKISSVLDIFRIKDGKIAEHWDIIQEVPSKSANPHPMF